MRRLSLLLMTSVVVMATTAGITLCATSAKEGMVMEETEPDEVWMGADWAFDFFMNPRSALMMTPKATEAMISAMVDKTRLVI